MEQPNQSPSFFKTFDGFAGVTSAFLAGLIGLSASYQLGFFWVLGLRWIHILEVTDYIALAAEWVPIALAVFAGSYLVIKALEKFGFFASSPGAGDATAPRVSLRARLISKAIRVALPGCLMILPTAFLFLLGSAADISAYLFLGAVVWCYAFTKLVPYSRKNATALVLAVFVPAALVWSASIGAGNAYTEMRRPSLLADLQLVDGYMADVAVLRYLQKGVFIRRDGQIELLKWERVQGIRSAFPTPSQTSRICKWFDIGCDQAITEWLYSPIVKTD